MLKNRTLPHSLCAKPQFFAHTSTPSLHPEGTSSALLAACYGLTRFPIGGAAPLGFTFIPMLFSTRERQFNFYSSILEIHPRRDKRESLLLRFPYQFPNFFLVNQKLSSAQRGMVGIASMFVRTDVAVQQPQFVVFDEAISIFQVRLSAPNCLYFGPRKNHSRLKFLQQEVVVSGVPVDSGISFSGRGGLAPRIFLRTGTGLMGRLLCHTAEKKVTEKQVAEGREHVEGLIVLVETPIEAAGARFPAICGMGAASRHLRDRYQ